MTAGLERNDRVCVVTGAASGIGQAVASQLLADGATVVAVDVDCDGLERLATERPCTSLVPIVGDVVDDACIDAITDAVEATASMLVNAAGMLDGFIPAGEVDDRTWERVLAVNLTAPLRISRALLPGMVDRGRGSIVNLTSKAGLGGGSAGAAYTSSKHALIGLTRNIAAIYGPLGVRCNAVAPGPVATNIDTSFRSDLGARQLAPLLAPLPGMVKCSTVAAAAVWLLSDVASEINGVVLPVDMGWAAF